jgi:hypothetical protein
MHLRRTTTSLLALLALSGCKQSDSILLIEVFGPSDLVPTQLSVTVTAGLDARFFPVPPMPLPGDTIALPASFTIALDRAHAGPITVSIDALDAQIPLGYGMTMQQHIQIGGQTIIPVMLMHGLPPDSPDAGQDGAGGQGGAPSPDAASDAGDAMGLDGATD